MYKLHIKRLVVYELSTIHHRIIAINETIPPRRTFSPPVNVKQTLWWVSPFSPSLLGGRTRAKVAWGRGGGEREDRRGALAGRLCVSDFPLGKTNKSGDIQL